MPAKAGIQYAGNFQLIADAAEYWIARSSQVKPGDDSCC
jgi:hypothetical protein